jgi:hypothetical protein
MDDRSLAVILGDRLINRRLYRGARPSPRHVVGQKGRNQVTLTTIGAMLSELSLGCSAKGRITDSLWSATPQAASPAISDWCVFCIQIEDKLY